MGKKLNVKFMEEYIKLDTACCLKFGIKTSGVSEYISRLYNTRLAPARDENLAELVKYRDIRNRLAHEEGAISQTSEIKKDDVRWVKKFTRAVEKKRDPISLYLKKAKSRARFRKLKIALITTLIIAVAVAAAVVIIF
jgi:hypothetical protein